MYKFFKKYHKWVGIIISFFLIMSAISGVIMNHRKMVSGIGVSRSLLPEQYQYDNWNNASVRGSIKLSPDSILLYGGAGIWLTDTLHSSFSDYNKGLKSGADNQTISRIVRAADHTLYAASTFDLYRLEANDSWINLSHKIDTKERIVDLAVNEDTLVVVSRSHLYVSVFPFQEFEKIELSKPLDYTGKATLFRTLWLLHSGELFGLAGQLFVDGLGLLMLVLCVTGIIYFFCPGIIKRKKRKEKPAKKVVKRMKLSLNWHYKAGNIFFIFLLILIVSGMFLRPPLLIAIIRSKVDAPPGTILNDKNPWHDKLRTLRYDTTAGEWILYSSNGFYLFKNISSTPQKLDREPPVSVMGVTVLEQIDSTGWVVGSFSGFYYWDRDTDLIIDCNTGRIVEGKQRGRPVSTNPTSGFAGDFSNKKIVFEYSRGARVFDSQGTFTDMPEMIKNRKMSLWHLCLEVHTGRIYQPLIGFFTDLYVFLFGLIALLTLISGYVIYHKKRRPLDSHPTASYTNP